MQQESSSSPAFGLVVNKEADTARKLFQHGVRIYVESRDWEGDGPAVLTCLASGVERMLKLTLGLGTVDQGDPWPGRAIRFEYGHDLVGLASAVDAALTRAREAVGGKPYVGILQEAVRDDSEAQSLLGALNEWAASPGRYRNLEALAKGELPATDSPLQLWEAVESGVTTTLGVQHRLAEVSTYPATVAAIRTQTVAHLALFWHLHWRAWQNGLVGGIAKKQAAMIDVTSATVPGPNRVRDLVQEMDSQITRR